MTGTGPERSAIYHASCVAIGPTRAGVLITGGSGSGKSALALELVGLGANLVSDDLTPVSLIDGHPVAMAPPRADLAGVIEARSVGLIRVPHQPRAPLVLVVDMDQTETERLPQSRVKSLFGVDIPLLYHVSAAYFPAAIFHLAQGGRYA